MVGTDETVLTEFGEEWMYKITVDGKSTYRVYKDGQLTQPPFTNPDRLISYLGHMLQNAMWRATNGGA
jgi:hypothetical protein